MYSLIITLLNKVKIVSFEIDVLLQLRYLVIYVFRKSMQYKHNFSYFFLSKLSSLIMQGQNQIT